jgi:hypothetical protein
MRFKEIVEARSNSKLNIKLSTEDELKSIAAQYGTEWMYVRFSSQEKFGIKPDPGFNSTPIGIYGYPLDYVLKMGLSAIPYKGSDPHIYVFKYIGDPNNLMRIGEADLTDMQRNSILGGIHKWHNKHDMTFYPREMLDDIQEATENYELTYNSAETIARVLGYFYRDPDDNDLDITALEQYQILKRAGLSGVTDNKGMALIHLNESTQAVFFNIRELKVIKSIFNTNKNHDGIGADQALTVAKMFNIQTLDPERASNILSSPLTAFRYAVEVLKQRWPKGEVVIKQNSDLWNQYQTIFNINDSGE